MKARLAFALLAMLLAMLLASARVARAQTPPPEEGDVQETLDIPEGTGLVVEGEKGAPAPPPKEPEKPRADKFELRGFTRLTAGAGLHSIAPEPAGTAPQERVPYDRAFVEQHLYLDLRYARGKWFRAVATGSLSLAMFAQENRASTGAPTSGFDVQSLDPILREAYVGFTIGRLDLRIGQQRIAWGNSDAYAPNDVMNGRDVRNPFLFDTEMLELPSPAVRTDLDLGIGTLGVVFEPFVPADRFDLYGTNWAIVQNDAPRAYRRLFGSLTQGLDRNAAFGLQNTLASGALGGSNPVNATLGTSLKLRAGSFDLSWYFSTGFDRQPALYVDPAFQKELDGFDAANLNGAVFDAVLNQTRASTRALGGPVLVSYRRRSHVGFDASTTIGSFVLRTDLAYDSARTFFAKDTLNASLRPAAQEVVGLEYQTGSLYKVVGVEAWAQQIVGREVRYVPALDPGTSGPLLFFQDQSYGMAGLVRWLWGEHIVLDARATVGMDPFWWSIRPEVGYQDTTFTVRAGLLALDGTDGAIGDWYRRNTTAYVTSKVSF